MTGLRRFAALGALFTFILTAAAQCGSMKDPTSSPFQQCPSGYMRTVHVDSHGHYLCEKM